MWKAGRFVYSVSPEHKDVPAYFFSPKTFAYAVVSAFVKKWKVRNLNSTRYGYTFPKLNCKAASFGGRSNAIL